MSIPTEATTLEALEHPEEFIERHIGPNRAAQTAMLEEMGLDSLESLIKKTVPAAIRAETTEVLARPASEQAALAELAQLADQNQVLKSFIGLGYHATLTPNVILRNVLENPGWYTAYTPY